jgi:iron(III) transport system permease protein
MPSSTFAPSDTSSVLATSIRYGLSALLFGVLGVLILVPLIMVFYTAFIDVVPFSGDRAANFTLANFRDVWSEQFFIALRNTVIVSAGGTCVAMFFGCGLAWLGARSNVPWKPLVHLSGVMPLFVSLLVAAVTWSLLGAGFSGYLNIIFRSLGLPFGIEIRSLAGIAIVEGLYYAPYAYIFLHGALSLVHPDLEEAAAIHGASMAQTLRRVSFPLVKPALIGSALLTFVLIAEDFPVPQILGGPVGIETLSMRIYNMMTRVPNHPNQASALSVVLTVAVWVLIYTQRRILGTHDYRTVTGKGMQPRIVELGRWRWVAAGFVALYAFVAIGLPIWALLQGALRANLFIPNAAAFFDFSHFSLTHVIEAVTSVAVRDGLYNSVVTGLLTAVLGCVFLFLLAYAVNKTDLPGRKWLEYIAMVPLALPAIVLALGILWTWVPVPLPVYGSIAILVIAFLARFTPQGFRAISASVGQIHDDLEHAAQVAGATKVQTMRLVTLPLVRGGVAAAAFLLFVLSLREVAASLFLYTTRTRVISIVLLESYDSGMWSNVASISLLYTVLLIAVTLVGRRWMRPGI